jgi:alpha-glucosidase
MTVKEDNRSQLQRKAKLAAVVSSRRDFLLTAVSGMVLASSVSLSARPAPSVTVSSPNNKLQFQLFAGPEPTYRITVNANPVIETSKLGIVVDGTNLTSKARIGPLRKFHIRERYPTRGIHSLATDRANGAQISLTHAESNTSFTLEIRAFDDGAAFRFIVPGEATRAPDEASSFRLPAGSVVWYHDFEGHYEGLHAKKLINDIKDGEWAAPPVTFKLPKGGYGSISEAALANYAGMGLQADGRGGFNARLGHALPVSYPFRLRYGLEEAERLRNPARISGTIQTPWRVVLFSPDLNGLVNSDLIANLSAIPDKKYFPDGIDTPWIKPGRAVWKFLDGGENTLESMKEFSRLAGLLGFEYNVVEGFWQRWSEEQMRELTDFSRQHSVGVWFWKHRRDLRTAEQRRTFFSLCRSVGVVGAKIDFFDHEAKEVIDEYHSLLEDAAEFKLMVDFHGANKPTGESRTWPNEMTREGVYGLEHRSIESWARHNTTVPFTRLLAGHADYTPMHFGARRKETSWAHQIATAAAFSSPVLIYAAHPKTILENPAVEMIRNIPSTWDETIVLAPSEIGELAAFARRKGRDWFVVVLNGPTVRSIRVPLTFLSKGKHHGLVVRDRTDEAAAVQIDRMEVTSRDQLTIDLRHGGGFVGRFTR